jgi:hypothetical protein
VSEPYVPGPYDEFRGFDEIDCYECLPPELKATFRIGKFIPVGRAGGDAVGDAGAAPSPGPPQDPPPDGS